MSKKLLVVLLVLMLFVLSGCGKSEYLSSEEFISKMETLDNYVQPDDFTLEYLTDKEIGWMSNALKKEIKNPKQLGFYKETDSIEDKTISIYYLEFSTVKNAELLYERLKGEVDLSENGISKSEKVNGSFVLLLSQKGKSIIVAESVPKNKTEMIEIMEYLGY